MIRLKIRNNYFRIIDDYQVNESSREVKFSSLKVDFTNKTIADLPLKYQEVKLVELDDYYNITKTVYTGYVNNYTLPKMKNKLEYRELELDLLSPLAMATARTVDAVGTYNLQPLVMELIQPLIDDGFVLKEFNITNNQITVNYLMETVESALNKLSNKFNFWWFIDENKNIYINSIAYLLAKKPAFDYNVNNKINGLVDVIPSIDATDYCNTVNFVNLRLYTESHFLRKLHISTEDDVVYDYYNPLIKVDSIPVGEKVEFDIPFVLNQTNKNLANQEVFRILHYPTQEYCVKMHLEYDANGNLRIPSNIKISDSYSDEAEWVLVRDTFFQNLIVGLQYNGTAFTFAGIETKTALMWTKLKISDEVEVNKNKGLISQTGIVEKQIDMNEQWKTYEELLSIANSYIGKNTPNVETVVLNVDKETNFKVGDTIKIDRQDFFINGLFIITDKKESYSDNVKKWSFTLKNTSILESYIDLFRASEQEENTEIVYTLMTSNYVEEGIKESYEVVVNES